MLNKNKYLNVSLINSKIILSNLNFIKNLKQSLKKKNIIVLEEKLNLLNNSSVLKINVFYRTNKICYYRRKLKVSLKKKNFFLNKLFKHSFKILKNSVNLIIIKNLNLYTCKKKLKFFYFKTKNFINILFLRRFNLFIDFVKITSLFTQSHIGPSSYIRILGEIFSRIQKNRHTKFIFLLKYVFKEMLCLKNPNILGVKFILNGKIRGKEKASVVKFVLGKIPIQTIQSNIEFAKLHVYTLYGVFGFKLWINYSSNFKNET
jgi:hypothetical protein